MTLVLDIQTYTEQPRTTVTFDNQAATSATYTQQTTPTATYSPVSATSSSFADQTASTITYDAQERVDGSFYGEGDYSFWYYAAREFYLGRSE